MKMSLRAVLRDIAPQVELDVNASSVAIGSVRATQTDRRDLVRDLGTFIYTHFHVGHHHETPINPMTNRDLTYEGELSRRYADRVTSRRVSVRSVHDDYVIVDYLGLRVRAPRSEVPVVAGSGAEMVADLPVPLIAPALSPGFALARGPVDLQEGAPALRIYFGSRSREHGTQIFHAVLDALRHRRRWHAKVTSQPGLYPRADAVTVYLHPDEVGGVQPLIDATSDLRVVGVPTSRFAVPLGVGVSAAWDPIARGVSFGQHRARTLARLMVSSAVDGHQGGDPDPHTVEAICRERGVDPEDIWRNPSSPDPSFLRHLARDAIATDVMAPT